MGRQARINGARALLRALIVPVALAAALALPAAAEAIVGHVPGGPTVSYQPLRSSAKALAIPLDSFFSNLDYNGGPVMPQNINYVIFWAPAGSSPYPSDYQPGIERYFSDLAAASGTTENVESVAAQYNDSAGHFAAYSSHFGGALLDTDPYPASGCKRAAVCMTDAQLRTELVRFTHSHGLRADLEHEYFLLTPPGVESCFEAAGFVCSAGTVTGEFCAYHGAAMTSEGPLIYANDPYVTGLTGCDKPADHPNGSSDGALIGGLSHEHNESITDPLPNSAWADGAAGGSENGDKCRTFGAAEFGTPLGTAPDGSPYNQVINGDLYYYQQEWSNQTHQCLQRLSFSGLAPTASFSAGAPSGNEVSFDASASSAPGGVSRYEWQFEGGVNLPAPMETTVAKITHTFPGPGVYNVALTVLSADGTSTGTSQQVTVGTPPKPAVTKVSPVKGSAQGGYPVTLTGTGFGGATQVHFDNQSVPFVVESATTITVTAPEAAGGTGVFTVTGPGGTSASTLAGAFKFLPIVSGVSPASGPVLGGTLVTVTGAGFSTAAFGTVLKFGTSKGRSVSCSSNTQCTVLTPAHAAGSVDVSAVVGKVASTRGAADHFTFE